MSLAVVTCFFNFSEFRQPQANLHRFLRQMKKDNVPVYGTEMSFTGRFLTTQEPHWTQVVLDPAKQSLWQKEAALNLTAKRLPTDVTAIAWVDADVWLTDPRWPEQTLQELNKHEVVQLFRTCHWTNEFGAAERSIASCTRIPLSPEWKSHSGFAWAMRRGLWDSAGGLYPFALSGGGDSIMAAIFTGVPVWDHLWRHVGKERDPFVAWAQRFKGISAGHTPGDLFHEWHGSIKDRDYYGRASRLEAVEVSRHLEYDKRGLLRWTEEAPDTIVRAAAEYFPSRREDGR